jgi:hypothetical protein
VGIAGLVVAGVVMVAGTSAAGGVGVGPVAGRGVLVGIDAAVVAGVGVVVGIDAGVVAGDAAGVVTGSDVAVVAGSDGGAAAGSGAGMAAGSDAGTVAGVGADAAVGGDAVVALAAGGALPGVGCGPSCAMARGVSAGPRLTVEGRAGSAVPASTACAQAGLTPIRPKVARPDTPKTRIPNAQPHSSGLWIRVLLCITGMGASPEPERV